MINNHVSMTTIKYLLCWIIITIVGSQSIGQGYLLGIKSQYNGRRDISDIETASNKTFPLVSMIYDRRTPENQQLLDTAISRLWTGRMYHLTLSPFGLSAEQIAKWAFDEEYISFFQFIKEHDIKVMFRTMHEMNGGRYSRSSNPYRFKQARKHMRILAAKQWLKSDSIKFIFSVNHRDLPTTSTPSPQAPLIQCNQRIKMIYQSCYTREDYYPGDIRVDYMGLTMYNRGKGQSDRQRLWPKQIAYEPGRNVFNRIKNKGKPIVIDEVATTAVRYEQHYSYQKSLDVYKIHKKNKDKRLRKLKQFIVSEPMIKAVVYFNVDYTDGLRNRITGEADWKAVWLHQEPWDYEAFWELMDTP